MIQKAFTSSKFAAGFLGAAFSVFVFSSQIASAQDSDSFFQVDLSDYYDLQADESSEFGTWEVVPKGRQVFDNIPFDVDGMVRLLGRVPPPHGTIYREEVAEIPVGQKFERLHLLHGTGWTTEDGEIVAHLVFRYSDGEEAGLPIVYGGHVRDWWHRDLLASGEVTDPNSRVAWVGYHKIYNRYGVGLRWYRTSFKNPYPDKEVESVDLVSTRSAVTPAVLSMTVGPEVEPGESAYGDDIADAEQSILFQILDLDSDEEVGEAAVHLSYATEHSAFYWGSFATDKNGVAEVTYPHPEVRWISVTVFAEGKNPKSIRWNREAGDEIPASKVVRLEKDESNDK